MGPGNAWTFLESRVYVLYSDESVNTGNLLNMYFGENHSTREPRGAPFANIV